jgi:hypothetical protein
MNTGEYKWYQERTISFGRNKRVEIKRQNMKRKILLRQYDIDKKENLGQVIEELKQKVSGKTRLSRYRKRQNQYYQNKMFRTDCKKFYNLLKQTNTNVRNSITKEEIENIWKVNIYGKKVQHNEEAYWIKNQCQQSPSIEWSPIFEEEVTVALRAILNWRAHG